MNKLKSDADFMKAALQEARKAASKGEVPVGAVGVVAGEIIARGHNLKEKLHDPLGHAEIYLLQKLSRKLKRWRLSDVTVYVTLEPCLMCLGAMLQARIAKIVYATDDPLAGGFSHYRISVGNLAVPIGDKSLQDEASSLIKSFFRNRRKVGRI